MQTPPIITMTQFDNGLYKMTLFLTCWGSLLTCLYFWLANLHSFSKFSQLQKIHHLLWQVCMIIEIPICMVYWILMHSTMSKMDQY